MKKEYIASKGAKVNLVVGIVSLALSIIAAFISDNLYGNLIIVFCSCMGGLNIMIYVSEKIGGAGEQNH